jgi:hypothetical protein
MVLIDADSVKKSGRFCVNGSKKRVKSSGEFKIYWSKMSIGANRSSRNFLRGEC